MVLYKCFKVEDFFDIKNGKQPIRDKRYEVKDEGMINCITGVTINNGVGFYTTPDKHEVYKDELTLAKDGEYAGTTYLQTQEFMLAGHSTGLIKKRVISNLSLLYIGGVLNKYQKKGYWKQGGVMGSVTIKRLNEVDLKLPVKTLEDTEPDWEYMEDYIKQKELAYIGKLNQEFEQKKEQLIELIGEESEYINIEELPTAKFKVGDLFNIYTGKDLILGKLEKGNIPVISHSADNNGISNRSGKIETRPLYDKDRVISLADRGTFKAYVQQEDFYVGTRVKALEVKDDFKVSKEVLQYLATSINKLSELFDYSMNATGKIPELGIELPVNPEVSDLVPDWNTMEDYVNGIKHLYLHKEEESHKEKLELLFELTGWTEKDLANIENLGGGNN